MSNAYNNSQWAFQYPQTLQPPQDYTFPRETGPPSVERSHSENQSFPAYPPLPTPSRTYPVGSVAPQYAIHAARSRSADQAYVPDQTSSQHQFATTYDARPAAAGQQATQQRMQSAYTFPNPGSSQSSLSSDQVTDPAEHVVSDYLSTSPVVAQNPHLSQKSSHGTSSTASLAPKAKRQRIPDGATDDEDELMGDHAGNEMKAKARACERCKNLKVKCEFRTDTDPCKRCLNGGHTCQIPGKKKRRTPPKREHLMSEIREQADRIRVLMGQLDDANKKLRQPGAMSDMSSQSSTAASPPPALSSPSPQLLIQDVGNGNTQTVDTETNRNVAAWIAKAKESFAEFEGFLNSGAAVSKEYHGFVGNPEDSSDSEGIHEEAGDGEYDISVIDSDGEENNTTVLENAHRRTSSTSSGSNVVTKGVGARLSKTATLPPEAAPFGLMANLSLRRNKHRGKSAEVEDIPEDTPTVGVASENFFTSPGLNARQRLSEQDTHMPQILTQRIITTSEAEGLFKTYFERMNLSLSLVDPILYTAQNTCYRSPFMFTVICAIASRYNTERPGLYEQLMPHAQLEAGSALITGPKNVEMCIAYILLSLFPVPTRRWEDQRGWLYLGLAIRTAFDINLHLPNTAKPINELHAREMLNRTRVWLNCFNLDRSTGSQYGKLPIINNMDYTANRSETWWSSSPYNMEHFDIHISCYNAELRVVGRFLSRIYSDPNHPTGLNKEVDFARIATEVDEELKCLKDKWMTTLYTTDMKNAQNRFRTGLLKLAYSYARLVVLSFAFQHAFGKNNSDENPFLARCLSAAYDVVDVTVNELGQPEQRIYLRHGPEAQTVFVTFASTFLIKLLQPKYRDYISIQQREHITRLVQSVINLLGSPDVAVDERHGPMAYSRFLKSLLEVTLSEKPTSRTRRSKASSSSSSSSPLVGGQTQQTTPAATSAGRSSYSQTPPSSVPSTSSIQFSGYDFAMQDSNGSLFAPQRTPDSYADAMQNLLTPDPEFFRPPLPFDDDMLQSMQSLSDTSTWPMPCFDWMSNYRGSTNQYL